MKIIQTKLENIIYGYNPAEFMPIYEDGRLRNRGQYLRYRVRAIANGSIM